MVFVPSYLDIAEKASFVLRHKLPQITTGLKKQKIKLHRVCRKLEKNYRKLLILINEMETEK